MLGDTCETELKLMTVAGGVIDGLAERSMKAAVIIIPIDKTGC